VDHLFSRWQPDGIAYEPGGSKVHLLEFTRCADDRKAPPLHVVEHKLIKYSTLLDSIRHHNPQLQVDLLTFSVGYLGTLDPHQFTDHFKALLVPDKHWAPTIKTTIMATMSSFTKMAGERTAAMHSRAPKLTPNIWAGRPPPLPHRPLPPRRA
jgi:hypothetical protein